MKVMLLSVFVVILLAQTVAHAQIKLLIVDGMNNHDWPRGTQILREIYESSGRFTVDVSTSPPTTQPAEGWNSWRPAFEKYDVVVSNFNGGHTEAKGVHWPRHVEQALEKYVTS